MRSVLVLSAVSVLTAATLAQDNCDSKAYSVTLDATATSVTPDLTGAVAAVRDTFLGRAYLPRVLPSPRDLNGYAGYVLNVYGTRNAQGICVQDSTREPTLDPVSYFLSGKEPRTEPVGDILTNIVVRKGGVGSVSYLTFISAGLTDSMRAEVVIEDLARQNAAGMLDEARLRTLANSATRQGVCAREIILVAQITSFKARTYHEVEKKAKLAGYGLAVDGKLFGSASSFTNHYRLFIESRPIDAYAGPTRPGTPPRVVTRIKFRPAVLRP
jgi:hypothetical protein